jgi:hypothetical protein
MIQCFQTIRWGLDAAESMRIEVVPNVAQRR